MKKSYVLITVFILFVFRASSINLKQALVNKQIAVELSGANYDSMAMLYHPGSFNPKMQMAVSNLGPDTLTVDLDPGYMLEASEPGYQAMLLVQSIKLKLGPAQKQTQYLYAMCTELTKSSPNASLHYNVAGIATPPLLQLAVLIASNKYWTQSAQESVWSISDDLPVMSIHDGDTTIQNNLAKQVTIIKGLNLETLKEEYERRKSPALAEFNGCKSDRNIVFSVKDTAMVSVGFYNSQGNLVCSVFDHKLFKEGKHCIRYNPFPLALAGQRYTVRMIRDGRVCREYFFLQ